MDEPSFFRQKCLQQRISFFRPSSESLFNEKQRNLKSDPKPTRRGHKGKNNFQSNLRIIGVNANGISSELNSLNHLLKELNPSVLCIQETKKRKMGGIKIESKDYHIFESVRKKNSNGGGLATVVKSDLNPVWIGEGDDIVEILIVEIHVDNMPIRIINGYGPQEPDSVERKTLFWSRMNMEIKDAVDANIGIA